MKEQTSALSYKSGYADGRKDTIKAIKAKIVSALNSDKPYDEIKQIIANILDEGEF
jgi:hypothetical protein